MSHATSAAPSFPRIGAVSYLNSKPLIEGLAEKLPNGLVLDYPSRLADSLLAGELDVALVPSIEVLRRPSAYEVVSDSCVAAAGPVRSVKVYFRVPPGEVTRLALDEGSRTSAVLSRVLLFHKYGVDPAVDSLPLESGPEDSRADAILLIGDRAMSPLNEPFVEVWDLGEEWWNWTGLPFVFAVWASRRDRTPSGLHELLSSTRDAGVSNAVSIAHREAERLGLDPTVAVDYLTKNLHFVLGPAARSGLKLFAKLAQQAGVISEGADIVFRDGTDHVIDTERQAQSLEPGAGRRSRLVGAR